MEVGENTVKCVKTTIANAILNIMEIEYEPDLSIISEKVEKFLG